MKKALLLWILFTPLVTATEMKEDLPSVSPLIKGAGERLEDWTWNFKVYTRQYTDTDFCIYKIFTIEPFLKNSLIEKISLKCYFNGIFIITVETIKKIDVSFEYKDDRRNIFPSKNFSVAKNEYFSKFLSSFYQNQYLPDCIIDLIFEKTAHHYKIFIDDFRLTPAKLALELNQFLTEESCEEDVQAFLTQKLETVKNPERRQNLIASMIVNLQEKNPFAFGLIKTLAQEVIDPAATSFAEVKSIQSDIEMNDVVTESDQQKRYSRALQTLLDIPSNSIEPEIQDQINTQIHTLVKNIYHNNQPNNDPLPRALQDLKLNSDSMLKMLAHISQLTQENQKLQQQLKQDVTPDGSN